MLSLFERGKIPGKVKEQQPHPYLKKKYFFFGYYLTTEILLNILFILYKRDFLDLYCQCGTWNGFYEFHILIWLKTVQKKKKNTVSSMK